MNINGKNAKFISNTILSGGNIISVLAPLPQVPFTRFALTFHGGANAVLQTPACGAHFGVGGFVPWSGNPGVFALGNVSITQTSTGAACP